MPVMEPGYYGLWAAKQTGRGTPATVASQRYAQVTGDFAIARADGSENVGDLTKYNPTVDWVNSIVGNGTPGIQATPTELAHLLWLFHGAETVTAETGPPAVQRHRFTPSINRGFYASYWRRVGQSVVQRYKHNDALITQIQIEGSTANKAVRITPTILSLDPGETFTADPTTPATLPQTPPMLYTDGAGAFKINGVVYREQSQFSLTINDAWEAAYGDDVVAYDLTQGTPTVTIAATMLFSAEVLELWNTEMYGTPTPAAGTKPVKAIMPLGSYDFSLTQKTAAGAPTGLGLDLTIPNVKWTVPDAPGPNPDGGSTEVAFSGTIRPNGVDEPYTIDVFTADDVVAFTS